MSKRKNMGRKSHHVQDAQYNQTIPDTSQQIGEQPTRPSVHPQQAVDSSKEMPKDTN